MTLEANLKEGVSTIFSTDIGISYTVAVIILTLLHSERPKLYAILAYLSAIGIKSEKSWFYSLATKKSWDRTANRVEICLILLRHIIYSTY